MTKNSILKDLYVLTRTGSTIINQKLVDSMFAYLPTLKSQKSDSAMRSEQASVASALRPGVQGPAQGPLVGSRGNAPVGVKGAKPPEAPGLVHFKNQ